MWNKKKKKETTKAPELKELKKEKKAEKIVEEKAGEAVKEEVLREQEDYLAGWQRCKADFENYQKKVSQLLFDSQQKTKERLITEVIGVLDNFNLAVGYIPKDQMKEGWVIGVIYIKKQLEDFLKKEEVEEILILGEDFNPEFAECLEELPESGKDNKGKVMEIIQNGYRLNGRVIRAAKVKIGG